MSRHCSIKIFNTKVRACFQGTIFLSSILCMAYHLWWLQVFLQESKPLFHNVKDRNGHRFVIVKTPLIISENWSILYIYCIHVFIECKVYFTSAYLQFYKKCTAVSLAVEKGCSSEWKWWSLKRFWMNDSLFLIMLYLGSFKALSLNFAHYITW